MSLNIIKLLLCTLTFLNLSFVGHPKTANEEALVWSYIDKYRDLAIAEMYRTGIPASIILAQGLHESNNGQSSLATEANNHFGIKCKSYWVGMTYYHKDDDYDRKGKIKDSCFRAYGSALESYVDHSNFLKTTKNLHTTVLITKAGQ